MDLHHKLRRPRGSSIHACNICGKEGHQAANCPNGTVNWQDRFKAGWGGVVWGLDRTGPEFQAPKRPWEDPEYTLLRGRAVAYADARKTALDSGLLDIKKEAMQVKMREAMEIEQKKRRRIEAAQRAANKPVAEAPAPVSQPQAAPARLCFSRVCLYWVW